MKWKLNTCIGCNSSIEDEKFCGICGQKQCCINCGERYTEIEAFCRTCGTAATETAATEDVPASVILKEAGESVLAFSKTAGKKIAKKSTELHKKYEDMQEDKRIEAEKTEAQLKSDNLTHSISPEKHVTKNWSSTAIVSGVLLVISGIFVFLFAQSELSSFESQLNTYFGNSSGNEVWDIALIAAPVVAIIGVLLIITSRRKKSTITPNAAPTAETESTIEKLEKLTEMLEKGHLTKEEYEEAKRKLL